MDRYDITMISKMLDEGYTFKYRRDGKFCFSRPHIYKGETEYAYFVRDVCEFCDEPHFKRSASKTKAHNKCKMTPRQNPNKEVKVEYNTKTYTGNDPKVLVLISQIELERDRKERLQIELDGYRSINPEYIDKRLMSSIGGCSQKINRLIKKIGELYV